MAEDDALTEPEEDSKDEPEESDEESFPASNPPATGSGRDEN
jgi:hypothetical protein